MASEVQQTEISRYIVGIFGAPAGGYNSALVDYVDASANQTTATQTMAKVLANTAAFKNLNDAYADGTSDGGFAAAWLADFLPDSITEANVEIAEDYMENYIAKGHTRAEAMIHIIDLAANMDEDDANYGAARIQLDNKVAVAETYTLTNAGDSEDIATLRGYVASVTEVAATVTTAEAALPTPADPADPTITGETFTLTTGTDSFVGTALNDLFTSANGTLVAADTILDSSSTDDDVMNITSTDSGLGAVILPRIQNVETINVVGPYVSAGLNLANVSGTTDLNISAGIIGGTAGVLNASSLNALNINAGTNIATVNVTATASGTRDTVYIDSGAATTVIVAGGAGADNFDVDLAGTAAATFNGGASIDSYTVNISGATTATLTGNAATETMTINNTTTASTVNVGGVLTAAYVGATPTTNVTTITGDAAVTLVDASVNGASSTLQGLVDSSTAKTTLKLTGSLGAAATDLKAFAVDEVELNNSATGGAGIITVNTASTVNVTGTGTGTIVLNVDDALGTSAATNTLLLNVSQSLTSVTTGAGVQTAIITATPDQASDTANNASITLGTLALGAANTTIVAQGSDNLTITALTNNAATDVFSATTMTGNLTIAGMTVGGTVAGGTGNDSITTGATGAAVTIHGNEGNDTINAVANTVASVLNGNDGDDKITGGTAADTINGGAGDDVIYGGTLAVVDTITTGAGSDTVTIVTGTGTDVITDFVVGTDKLVLTGLSAGTGMDLSALTPAAGTYTFDANFITTLTGITATDLSGSVQLGSQATATVAAATYTTVAANITAGSFNDHITQSVGALTLNAGAGDDVIVSAVNFAATLTGGAGSDTFNVTNTAASTISDFAATDILVTGAAANSLTVTVIEDFVATAATANSSTATGNVTLSLNDGIDADMTLATMLAGGVGYTITANALATTGSTISGSRAADIITGSKNADTITGGEGADAIAAGKGVDTIILTESVSAADVVTVAALDTGITLATADTITGFATGVDTIAAYLTGAAEGVIANGTALTDFAAFVTAANAVLTAGVAANDGIYISYNAASSGDAWVAIDENDSGSLDTGDTVLVLSGINLVTEIALTDFV